MFKMRLGIAYWMYFSRLHLEFSPGKVKFSLVLPVSHNASFGQHSKDWASVGMAPQNEMFIGIVNL